MEHLSDALEAMADGQTASKALKQMSSLRGVRGVPFSEVAKIGSAAYEQAKPRLPEDELALHDLFTAAYEDGLVAIGLLSTVVPASAEDALALAMDWATRVDDVQTADALGWLVVGPCIALLGQPYFGETLRTLGSLHRGQGRRVAAAAGMAFTPAMVQGPAAAPLRAKAKNPSIRITDHAHAGPLAAIADKLVRDESATVHKALRRMLRAWANDDPASLVRWADARSGSIPAVLNKEVKRARRMQ